MSKDLESKKDHSGTWAMGGAAAGAAGAGATLATIAGGSASASAITYALGAIGGTMIGGLGVLLAAPVACAGIAYGAYKIVKKNKKKSNQ